MSVSGGVKSFLLEKFWKPIVDESTFYNPFNTAAYSAVFALVAAYVAFPLLKKMDVEVDRRFIIAITPFVFLGGAARSLKDLNVVNSFLLETPFIYIVLMSFGALTLYVSKKIGEETDFEYHMLAAVIGTTTLLGVLSAYTLKDLNALIMIAGVYGISVILLYGLGAFVNSKLDKMFYIPVFGHLFDAATSFTALTLLGPWNFREIEKHVLARFFVNPAHFGPSGIFVMKLLIIVPATYYIYTEFEGEKRNYYLFLIAMLGFALGTRNMLSLVAS